MVFTKRLQAGVRDGSITRTVRIWKHRRVNVGQRYRFIDGGWLHIDAMRTIEISDITPKLARECGFEGVVDLLKTAQHGAGTNVYLIDFHYVSGS
jgi:hypothetical protein